MPPKDLILEPDEKVVVATRPLFLWEPLILLLLALTVGAGIAANQRLDAIAVALAVAAVLLAIWIVARWIPWRARWFVLTDRRVIARWGVFNRNQSALLLDRIQDASLGRPFPKSLIRDFGIVHLESAGEHRGLRELEMTGASRFYRALTDAQTPGR